MSSRRSSPPALSLAAAVTLALAAGGVRAARAGDGESAASVGVGLATYAVASEAEDDTLMPAGGATVQATYERGFGDYASWRVHGAGAIYGGGGVAGSGLATIGLTYRLDILRYVPYALVGVGVLARGGGPFDLGLEPALELGAGVDILRGRDRSWGAVASVTSFAGDTTTISLTARSTWRWGYF